MASRYRYQAHLSQLQPYHIITARCPFCRHTARMRLWQLKIGRPCTYEVEERLRCMRCGSRVSAVGPPVRSPFATLSGRRNLIRPAGHVRLAFHPRL